MTSEETKSEATAAAGNIEQWDLTSSVSPYLDRHMIFPLLEFLDDLIGKGVYKQYNSKDVAAARLALLRPTHMVDYAMDVYKSIHGEGATVPEELTQQKQDVYKQLEDLRNGCAPLDQLCKDEEQRNKLKAAGNWNLPGLLQHDSSITDQMVETYRLLAKYNFDCGDYKAARDQLAHYISLFAQPPPAVLLEGAEGDDQDLIEAGLQQQQQQQQQQQRDGGGGDSIGNASMYYLQNSTVVENSNMLQVLWGRLACEILVEDWPAAVTAIDAVRTALETMVSSNKITALEALQQRTWILHWALFVYWNNNNNNNAAAASNSKDSKDNKSSSGGGGSGLEQMVELFHNERYKQAITTNAPHLLRYLTAAVLLCKRRVTKKAALVSGYSNPEARRLLKNLIYVMQDVEYTDPIVEFVHSLCIKFDFELAQTKLVECQQVLTADFFLCQQTDLFMEEARVFVFENYCRIHHKIDLKAVGEKLAMDQDAAERWIVDLIRNADLDAKIDSDEGAVVMGTGTQLLSVYEQVVDRTRDLTVRSAMLTQNLNNLFHDSRKEKAKKAKAAREQEY